MLCQLYKNGANNQGEAEHIALPLQIQFTFFITGIIVLT